MGAFATQEQLAKVVKDNGEKTHIAIRNVRRDANKHADTAQTDKVVTQDDCARLKDEIQELTKRYEGKVDELVKKKTEALMEV